MRREIHCRHLGFLQHPLIIHDTVILSAVATSSVEEQDFNVTFASLLVEALAFAPEWRGDVRVSANDVIDILVRLFVGGCLANKSIVEEFEHSSPNVSPKSNESHN